jgi:PAS domain S-box-containing protein
MPNPGKDAKDEWTEKESYYRGIINHSSDLIFVTDMQGQLLDMNQTLCNKLGYTTEELLKKNVADIVDPKQLKETPFKFSDLRSGIPVFGYRRFICKDGNAIELEVNVNPFQGDKLLVIARDITLQIKAEKEKEQANYLLNERIKELSTLYSTGRILLTQLAPVEEVLKQLVDVFPLGWQFPEATAARIIFGSAEFVTPNFKITPYTQRACFTTSGGVEGCIEVVYLEEKPVAAEGPFLAEERYLINMLAEMLRAFAERKENDQRLAKNEEQLQLIYNNSKDVIFLLSIEDDRYRFTSVNQSFLQATGLESEQVIGHFVDEVIPEPSLSIVLHNYQEAIRLRKTLQWEETSDYPSGRRTGIVSVTPVFDEKGDSIKLVGTVHDITGRKQAQEQLKKEKELSDLLINSLPGVFYLFDENGKYLRWNKNHETIPGYTTEEMKEMYPLNFFGGDEKELIRERIEKVFTEGYADVEASFVAKDGTKIPFYFNGIAIEFEGKKCLMGVGINITEKKLLEQEIIKQKVQAQKKLTRAVLAAQERERNKIGMELHDNINQILVGAKMYLGVIQQRKEWNEELTTQSLGLVDSAITEMRVLSREEVTPQLKTELGELVKQLINHLQRQTDIQAGITFEIADPAALSEELKLNIYRLAQELVNNIIRHSQAHNVSLLLKSDDEGITLVVTDDGVGFDMEADRNGIGISNMINRVESYDGEMHVESRPGHGCRVEIRLPLNVHSNKFV